MTGDRVKNTRSSLAHARHALAVLAIAGLASATLSAAAIAQLNLPAGGQIPRLTVTTPNTIGGFTAPRPTTTGPAGTSIPGTNRPIPSTTTTFTTPTVTPRPTGPTGVTATTPTSNPTTGNPTTGGPAASSSGGVSSSSGGVPSGNFSGTPNQNVDPRVRNLDTSAEQSHFAMGANPNCSSYRSFEGFGGRACGQKGGTTKNRRNVVQPADGNGGVKQPKNVAKKGTPKGGTVAIATGDSIPGEIIIEVDGRVTEVQAIALARRFRLTRLESQNFPLINATMFRWRIEDKRNVDTVARQLRADGSVRSVQRNFRITLQQADNARDDPGQYAIGKLRLIEAHALSKGEDVRIAVIDSAIDVAHPELAGAIVGTYDALRSTEGAHTHGTGIAGAIVGHARLLGSAPSARLLAIRAFGATSSGAESTSFVVLKGLNYAVEHGAQIINMSFAGPKDPLLERGLAAAAKRGIILIAAAGNAGVKSPPLYPAADRNVIAVSATDAKDKLFEASNRGGHLAIAAPGVDLLLPSPDEKYQVASGTSFAAAYVSGLVALIIERNPGIAPDVVRKILTETAKDLGPAGKDEQFGAGLANALAAVQAARPVTAGAATRSNELSKPSN
jgi:subtilisin family serine protease